jgi:hypothetical protein
MVSTSDKPFTIQPNFHYEIFTGLTSNASPILATKGIGDVLVLVLFNLQGEITHFVESPQLDVKFRVTNNPIENDKRYEAALEIALQNVGVSSIRPIQVKKFFIPKHLIGIRQYPDSLQRFLDNGPEYTHEEIQELQIIRVRDNGERFSVFSDKYLTGYSDEENEQDRDWFKRWTTSSDFVLWCQNDFWCDANGYIHSS